MDIPTSDLCCDKCLHEHVCAFVNEGTELYRQTKDIKTNNMFSISVSCGYYTSLTNNTGNILNR
jgi:hypothetical protein